MTIVYFKHKLNL